MAALMRTIEQLREEAASLGIAKDKIADYCLSQQKVDRDERAMERDREKIEAERETKRIEAEREMKLETLKAEREREKIQAEQDAANLKVEAFKLETEREKFKLELQEAENARLERESNAKREFELAKLTLEGQSSIRAIETDGAANSSVQGSSASGVSDLSSSLKLPNLRDGEDISSFLIRFERMAELLTIPRGSYAVRLGAALSGRALDIYASLPADITNQYDSLKAALLKGFNKTAESYRREFRSLKISSCETFSQFATKLGRVFDSWLEAIEVPKTFEGLRSFLISDQLVSSVSPDLRIFLKENDPKSLESITKLADNWTNARGSAGKGVLKTPFRANKPQSSANEHKSSGKDSTVQYSESPRKFHHNSAANNGQYPKNIKCFGCGDSGHIKAKCPKMPILTPGGNQSVNFCLDDKPKLDNRFVCCGTVNGSRVSTIMRDTGCTCIIVSEDLIPDTDLSQCRYATISDFLGEKSSFPVIRCHIKCPYYTGWTEAIRAPIRFCSVLIGNVPGAKDFPANPPVGQMAAPRVNRFERVAAVTTRGSKRCKPVHPLCTSNFDPIGMTPGEFRERQSNCPSLSPLWAKAKSREEVKLRNGTKFTFIVRDSLLFRKCVYSNFSPDTGKLALVIPDSCREIIMKLSHEALLSGHFSHRKTQMRIRDSFFWPTLDTDVRNFCKSCDVCQRTSPKGRVKPAPLIKVPVITEPFSRVSIDLVGPFSPPSESGHRFILTLIDHATGFPEAVPLKDIDTIAVSEALLGIFSRVGIPREILSDQGPQFTSKLMGELHRLLGVKPLFSSTYHPMGNARVERLHSTLVSCLRKLCIDRPKLWHRFLVPTLFALREIPSDRTGFSAFELLYGRQVRGPLSVLRDLWTDSSLAGEERDSFQHVLDLRKSLEDCSELASAYADKSTDRFKTYFDLKSQNRYFNVGDEVLILLPDLQKKLLLSWSGPHKVLERRGKVNYIIDQKGKPHLYHVNLLKKYHRRASVLFAYVADEISTLSHPVQGDPFFICNSCIIEEGELPTLDSSKDSFSQSEVGLELPDVTVDESAAPDFCPDLDAHQKADIENLIDKFSETLSPLPGCTDTVVHDIKIMTSEVIKPKCYPVPIHLQSHFEEEVDKLLQMDIIQPSMSPYRNPTIMLKKEDQTFRLILDPRAINAVTEFNAEPSCNLEEELYRFAGARYLSELDLTKAYHQIMLTPNARKYTAFATHRGLMEFKRLPFGLVTACATYIQLMRIVLAGLSNVSFYFDNILVYSKTWDEHVSALESVFERLRDHGLTVKPSKCKFGFEQLNYLGFTLGKDQILPIHSKTEAISQFPRPTTKKLLRSFLGMVSFYRKFIPYASDLTSPLSDMLRKEVKEPLTWNEKSTKNFDSLKHKLTSGPVLKLPDKDLTFVLRTDASNFGLGAVLFQYHENTPFPVSFASRKLLDRETKYSTIERECLAIVFAVEKFKYYLYGKEFFLEIDHKPLVYLNKFKGSNSRLLRWALCLQPFRFRIIHISGSDNLGADLLSRSP